MTNRDVVVEVNNLTKVFKKFKAVDSVSFKLYKGEILGLLGPNGAGKTTIIHMLLGLITPTSGEIKIFGLNPARVFHRTKILQRMNFSSTYVAMPYALTPRESLTVFARLYGIKNPSSKVNSLIEIFDLREIADEPIRALSSGQMTRLNLAKAFINDPEVLLLDEPTASLDPVIANRIRDLLREAKQKTSIIYTSHNMKEIEEVCNRVLFLYGGKIIASGSPEELIRNFSSEDLEEVFIKLSKAGTLYELL